MQLNQLRDVLKTSQRLYNAGINPNKSVSWIYKQTGKQARQSPKS